MAADPEVATAPLAETATGSRIVAAKAGTRLATPGAGAAGATGETPRRAARARAAATRTGTRHTAAGARAPIVDRSATVKAVRGPLSGAASGHARARDDGRRRATEDEGDRVTGNGVLRAATHAGEAPEAAEARTRIGVAETATGEKIGDPRAIGAGPATEEARIADEAGTRAAPIVVGRRHGPISEPTTETARGVRSGGTPEMIGRGQDAFSEPTTAELVRVATAMSAATTETVQGVRNGDTPGTTSRGLGPISEPTTETARGVRSGGTPETIGRGQDAFSEPTTAELVRVATAMSAATTETVQGVRNGDTPGTTAQLDRARGGAHAARTGHPVAARAPVPHTVSGAETSGRDAMPKSRKENHCIRGWSPGPTNRRHPPR